MTYSYKILSTIFVLILQNVLIILKYLFNMVFWLAVFRMQVQIRAYKVCYSNDSYFNNSTPRYGHVIE
jgi:hypothetical protein